jgi:UDP-N-acetylglucosamine--N-acetylmuramyl-(pentapeptide) pyrophosphoryl-undecaprenol N-acetylglucosamine transferase
MRIVPFIDDMPLYLAAADILICRCGAMTLAEAARSGCPTIMIPSPNVTNDHQTKNALAYAAAGAGILIEEKDIDEKSFLEKIRELRNDPGRLERMGELAHELAARSASDIIYEEIVKDLWKKTNA